MECIYCGKMIESSFCPHCGTKFETPLDQLVIHIQKRIKFLKSEVYRFENIHSCQSRLDSNKFLLKKWNVWLSELKKLMNKA